MIAAACLFCAQAWAQAPVPIDPPLVEELPWLLDQSSWRQDLDLDASRHEPLRRGSFALGNGLILATLGQGDLASTLRGIRLTHRSPTNTECVLTLAANGVVVRLPKQHLRRVRGANFVLSHDRGQDLSLVTLNYAEPGSERISRLIQIRNNSDHPIAGLTFSASLNNPEGLSLSLSGAGEPGCKVGSDRFELAPGMSRDFVLELRNLDSERRALPRGIDEFLSGAITTWDWWRGKLASTTFYDSDRAKLRDLIEDWKVNLLVLRDARSGAIMAPGYRSEPSPRGGTLLLLLRFGLWQEARQLLAHSLETRPGSDWDLLEHYWYWRATRDLALIERNWDALRSGLAHAAGRGPADTLRQATLAILASHCAGLLAGRLGHGQAESALLNQSREIRAATEDRFWLEIEGHFSPGFDSKGSPLRAPRAEQNYFPLWAGWTYASGMRSRRNLGNSLTRLWVGPRRSGSCADSGQGRAEIPGMLLAALTEQGQAERIEVIEEILAMAEPAGEWSTCHDERGRPMPARGGALDPAVAGLNLDAILYALTGLRHAAIPGFAERNLMLQLTLPKRSRHFTVRGARQDGRELNLYLRRVEDRLEFDLVLISNQAETDAAIPVAIRSMGNTHLGWLWDAASEVGASGGQVTPRRFSASSTWQAPGKGLLPSAYLR